MDTRRLAFSMGQGGTVGDIVWPRSVTQYTGEELPARVNASLAAGEPIDAIDETFMNKVSTSHPETEPFISEVQRRFRTGALGSQYGA